MKSAKFPGFFTPSPPLSAFIMLSPLLGIILTCHAPLHRGNIVCNHLLCLGGEWMSQYSRLLGSLLLGKVVMNFIHIGILMSEMDFLTNIERKLILFTLFQASSSIFFGLRASKLIFIKNKNTTFSSPQVVEDPSVA